MYPVILIFSAVPFLNVACSIRRHGGGSGTSDADGPGSDGLRLRYCGPLWPIHHLVPAEVVEALAFSSPSSSSSSSSSSSPSSECVAAVERVLLQDCCTGVLARFFEDVLDRFDWRVHYSYHFTIPQCRVSIPSSYIPSISSAADWFTCACIRLCAEGTELHAQRSSMTLLFIHIAKVHKSFLFWRIKHKKIERILLTI